MTILRDKVFFITGGSRGIGREIALRAAKEGARIAIAAKTAEPHPTLPGTIYSVAEEITAAGGQALPLMVDIRDEAAVSKAVTLTAEKWGGIDILVNNASAIYLANTEEIPMKRFDLIFSVNVRATFMCAKYCVPYLKQAENPHILNLSPPLSMEAKWFKDHLAYTMSKYGMSMCTLGMAAEFAPWGIAVNSLWPKTLIATAALAMVAPGNSENLIQASRKPSIVADAAYAILTCDPAATGQFFLDEAVLRAKGVTDFSQYALNPKATLYPDLYVE